MPEYLKRILKSYGLEVYKSLTGATYSAKLERAIFTCNFEMTDRPTARQSWINSNKNVSQCTCRAVRAEGAGGAIAASPDFGKSFCPIWADYAHHKTTCTPPLIFRFSTALTCMLGSWMGTKKKYHQLL